MIENTKQVQAETLKNLDDQKETMDRINNRLHKVGSCSSRLLLGSTPEHAWRASALSAFTQHSSSFP